MNTERTNSCTEVSGLLALYHYGEMPADEARLVEAHLASCGRCAAELGDIRAALGLVAADTPSGPEAARVRARVMERIRRPERSPLTRLVPALAGAALAAAAALVFSYRATVAPVAPGVPPATEARNAVPAATPPEVRPNVAAPAPAAPGVATPAAPPPAPQETQAAPADIELVENMDMLAELDLLEDMGVLDEMEEL